FVIGEQTVAGGQGREGRTRVKVAGCRDLLRHRFVEDRAAERRQFCRYDARSAGIKRTAFQIGLFSERRNKLRVLWREPRDFFRFADRSRDGFVVQLVDGRGAGTFAKIGFDRQTEVVLKSIRGSAVEGEADIRAFAS